MTETKKRKRMSVDWSDDIPVELLTLIADNIDSIESHIAFAAVCRSWYNVIAPYRITESTPWLMLSEKQDSASRSFFSFRGNNVFDIEFPPEIKGRRCWGSPFGWIITYDTNNDDMNLYNPLSKASIPLPKLLPYFASVSKYRGYASIDFVRRPAYLEKAVLTASPDSPDCMVFIIPSMHEFDELVYAKPSDTLWSDIEDANLGDVLSFRGNLYGCEWETGKIVSLNFETELPNIQLILKGFADAPPGMIDRAGEIGHEYHRKKYLVDLGGELHLVLRYVEPAWLKLAEIEYYSLTYDFEIYKIDLSAKVWKPVKCLGDHCLFVGTNNAFAIPVSCDHKHEPNGKGLSLRPNRIYFLDDKAFHKQSDGSDMGVFHVGKSNFGTRPLGENVEPLFDRHETRPQPFLLKSLACGLYSDSCPPLWITPYLQFYKPSYKYHHQIVAKDKKLPNMKVGSYIKITSNDEEEDDEIHKLKIQLKIQFTHKEKHGVNRTPWRDLQQA